MKNIDFALQAGVCNGAADLYQSALHYIKLVGFKIDITISQYLNHRIYYYKGLTYDCMRKAKAESTIIEYGAQIKYLELAFQNFDLCEKEKVKFLNFRIKLRV
jgi:hypothetical protein